MNERDLLRGADDLLVDFDRSVHVFKELLSGCRALNDLGPAVTIFGSARFAEGHRYYQLARRTARLFAEAGFAILTGGGPGVMEAANRGAREGGGVSVGCNIVLPKEQAPNPYLDRCIEFDHFFVRKVMLLKYSCAFLCLPGGLGTLDEIFETATLIQTGKMTAFPIVVMGLDFWQPLHDFIAGPMSEEGVVDHPEAFALWTDDPAEALAHVQRVAPDAAP